MACASHLHLKRVKCHRVAQLSIVGAQYLRRLQWCILCFRVCKKHGKRARWFIERPCVVFLLFWFSARHKTASEMGVSLSDESNGECLLPFNCLYGLLCCRSHLLPSNYVLFVELLFSRARNLTKCTSILRCNNGYFALTFDGSL